MNFNPFRRRKERPAARRATRATTAFFKVILPTIARFEALDELSLIDRGDKKSGIVLSYTFGASLLEAYVRRTNTYARRYGLKNFMTTRARLASFARKHNPDLDLLSVCQAARLVLAFRRAVAAGENGRDFHDFLIPADAPFFIVIMTPDLAKSTHTGVQQNDRIILDEILQ